MSVMNIQESNSNIPVAIVRGALIVEAQSGLVLETRLFAGDAARQRSGWAKCSEVSPQLNLAWLVLY